MLLRARPAVGVIQTQFFRICPHSRNQPLPADAAFVFLGTNLQIARFAPGFDEFTCTQFAAPRYRLPAGWLLL